MQNNVILENLEEHIVTEVDENIISKKEKENKKQNDLKKVNKKRHYSMINYPKVLTIIGKLELDSSEMNDLNTNYANMIYKAKNFVIKEKNVSTSSQIKSTNIRQSYLKFYKLNPNKIRLNEVIKTNILPNTSALKPTPFQKREEENLKYKKLIDLKQSTARIKKDNLIFDNSKIVKKIRLNSENKHQVDLPLQFGKVYPSNLSKNHTKTNSSIAFENSPSMRNSSVTTDYNLGSLYFDISHLKNQKLTSYNNKFNLPEIKTNTKNSIITSGYLSYEPKKKQKFLIPHLNK